MIISLNWLSEYVDLPEDREVLIDRLTMSGLNFDGSEEVGEDLAVDLEVTSNRADCLGHLGVAREVAVLFDTHLKIPDAKPATVAEEVQNVCSVELKNSAVCQRYTARLIRGVKIGPSPKWMQDRLRAIGIGVVNNVVDATNYVMFECGQPLHAFDFQKLSGGKILVRDAVANESFQAIDHKPYTLQPGMCVIADSEKPVAVGGVMGGEDSEVTDETTDVLIEAAWFDPLSVRRAARKLNLHSPSSFRFERDVDSHQLDWASRRCCDLILASAGGQLLSGVIDEGSTAPPAKAIVLRLNQVPRILGINIPTAFIRETLQSLGLEMVGSDSDSIIVVPPTWRKDLTREVDLIEEVGRIYGFNKIPDNASVPMAASHRPAAGRVLDRIRETMTAAGFDEAVTASLVPETWSQTFSPWSDRPPLASSQPMLGVLEKASQNIGTVNLLRRSLVPSLLEVRRINEYRSNTDIEIFETAKVYLTDADGGIPDQPTKLALVSERDYFAVKGVIETLVQGLNSSAQLAVAECQHDLLDANRSGELKLGDQTLGWLGEVSAAGLKQFGLRSRATVAELDLQQLQSLAVLIPQHQQHSTFPPVSRDFNFIVDDAVSWADLATTVQAAGGELLESVEYRETFRDAAKDGPDRKRLLLSVVLRSDQETLTGDQADKVSQSIIDQCQRDHSAALVG